MSLIDRKLAKDTNAPSNDCISRQAAIDEAEEWIEAVYCCHDEQRERDAIKHVINGIKKLPSAQPEIIRCRDCRWRKDQSGSTAWLPCRAIATPSEFYCAGAERRTDE